MTGSPAPVLILKAWGPSLVAAAVVAAAILLMDPGLAFAHSRPIRFDPAPGAVLVTAPATINGWFGSEIRRDPNWSFIHVTDAKGTRVDTGDSDLSNDRLQMAAHLKPNLPAGIYLVTWRTFDDADGAIFGDCFTFFVGQDAVAQAKTDKSRLDGGSSCQRIDFEAKNGTPTPAKLSAIATAVVTGEAAADQVGSGSGGKSGIPAWSLMVGVIAGAVIGGGGVWLARPGS